MTKTIDIDPLISYNKTPTDKQNLNQQLGNEHIKIFSKQLAPVKNSQKQPNPSATLTENK